MDLYAMQNSGCFALSSDVAVAVAVAQSFALSVAYSAAGVESSPLSNGKNIEVRLLELGFRSAGAYLLNTQVVNKGARDQTLQKRVGITCINLFLL